MKIYAFSKGYFYAFVFVPGGLRHAVTPVYT